MPRAATPTPQACRSPGCSGWPWRPRPPRRPCRGHRRRLLAAHVAVVASTEPEAFGRAAIEAPGHGRPGDRHRHRRPARDRARRARRCPGRHHRLAGAAGRCGGPGRRGWRRRLALPAPDREPWPGGPAPTCWHNSRWRPCNGARWPFMTGCWAPSLNGVSSLGCWANSRDHAPCDNLDLRYHLSDSCCCASALPAVCRTAPAPVQQPKETATYVAQCEPRLSASPPVRG